MTKRDKIFVFNSKKTRRVSKLGSSLEPVVSQVLLLQPKDFKRDKFSKRWEMYNLNCTQENDFLKNCMLQVPK